MNKKVFCIFAIMQGLLIASEQQPITHQQILPDEIICLIGTSFSPLIQPKEARFFIESMFFVNKKLCATLHPYIYDPNHTRILINKISNYCNQDIVAEQLKFPGSKKYLNINDPFHTQIRSFTKKTITRTLTKKCGDPHYFPQKKAPILFRVLTDCEKTKLLLDHGANINVRFNKSTILEKAITIPHMPLIKLLLPYNPDDKCLRFAVAHGREAILELILSTCIISCDEIHQGFINALDCYNSKAIQIFLNTGMNSSPHLKQAICLLRRSYHEKDNSRIFTLLSIIRLMCQHGAWDERAYTIASNSRIIPFKVLICLKRAQPKEIENVTKK